MHMMSHKQNNFKTLYIIGGELSVAPTRHRLKSKTSFLLWSSSALHDLSEVLSF